ncbi:hypothetical protein DEO72_LG11g237 [Vigna unguiculata]|uniref:Uncharacterized protein n=1 Tax=Vigna unguiculata TaxID=3917 RepID=A0A4D6NKQ8_VIGUN|nr:hypothetical protein DEO72_LG11g237 [Vigna unguiculata]
MYSEGLNHRGNPYQAPTPTQEGASPSGFRSTPTKHRVWTHGVFTRLFPGIPTIIDSLHPYTHYNFTLGFPLKSHSTSSLHAYIHPITSFNSSMARKSSLGEELSRSGESVSPRQDTNRGKKNNLNEFSLRLGWLAQARFAISLRRDSLSRSGDPSSPRRDFAQEQKCIP